MALPLFAFGPVVWYWSYGPGVGAVAVPVSRRYVKATTQLEAGTAVPTRVPPRVAITNAQFVVAGAVRVVV